jgi:hypothetical protein
VYFPPEGGCVLQAHEEPYAAPGTLVAEPNYNILIINRCRIKDFPYLPRYAVDLFGKTEASPIYSKNEFLSIPQPSRAIFWQIVNKAKMPRRNLGKIVKKMEQKRLFIFVKVSPS